MFFTWPALFYAVYLGAFGALATLLVVFLFPGALGAFPGAFGAFPGAFGAFLGAFGASLLGASVCSSPSATRLVFHAEDDCWWIGRC